MFDKGWAIFTDEKYMPLAKNAIESFLRFSKYEIYVMSINCNTGMLDDRIIEETVEYKDGMNSLFYQKTKCSLRCPFDVVGQIEADMVANICCDDLLETAEELDLPYTLHPIHGSDPKNQDETMRALGVTVRTTPYAHATYLFTNKARNFLNEVRKAEEFFVDKNVFPPNYDETIINCMLWKTGANIQLNCFDPSTELVPYYLGEKDVNPLEGYYKNTDMSYHIFHGSKDVNYMTGCFKKLDKHYPPANRNMKLKVLKY